jgi:cation diffusion facilitator family transporter
VSDVDGSARVVVAAFLANLGIALAKFVAFLLTRSASMLAESVHSLADTTNQGLLFLGRSRSRREASVEHPFGFGAERYFWAFVVAVVLFTGGSVFALYEGAQKLVHPHELSSPGWVFAVLGIGLLLEGLSFRTALREAGRARGDAGWWAFIRTATVPELPAVLLEDAAALVGLLLALGGVTMAEITGDASWDAAGSVGIGVLLGVVALLLAREMKSLLIGEASGPAIERTIRGAIADGPEVQRIIHLRTMYLGPDELLVAAKVEPCASSVAELAVAIDRVEARVRAAVPIARVIYLEPDVYRA